MEHDPTDLQGRAQREQARADKVKAAAFAETENVKWLMGSKRGRQIVWGLLTRAAVFTSSFDTNSLLMSRAEGMKVEGRWWLEQINRECPELYLTMVKEASK